MEGPEFALLTLYCFKVLRSRILYFNIISYLQAALAEERWQSEIRDRFDQILAT